MNFHEYPGGPTKDQMIRECIDSSSKEEALERVHDTK